jgi:predicted MFS family arabinose efflux permease
MMAGSAVPALAMALNLSVCNIGIAAGSILGGWAVRQRGLAAADFAGVILAVCALAIALLPQVRAGLRSGR